MKIHVVLNLSVAIHRKESIVLPRFQLGCFEDANMKGTTL